MPRPLLALRFGRIVNARLGAEAADLLEKAQRVEHSGIVGKFCHDPRTFPLGQFSLRVQDECERPIVVDDALPCALQNKPARQLRDAGYRHA